MRLVGRGRSDGCCAGTSRGVRSAGPHGLGSTLASKKERRSGLQITLRHTDTQLQRLTRRSAFRMYTFSTQTRLGGCRPADCLLMFGFRWSRVCCSCPMAALAKRLHKSVTLDSFSSGSAAIPSHPWLSRPSEHGGGRAMQAEDTYGSPKNMERQSTPTCEHTGSLVSTEKLPGHDLSTRSGR